MNAQLLEQQVKLNQLQHLQQLQQQIFQQQMAIINGQDFAGPPSLPPSPEISLTQPHSAPEHVAFNIYGGPQRRSFYVPSTVPEGADISPMPSPFLAGEARKRSSRNKSDDAADDAPRRSKPYRGSRSTNSTPFLGSSAPQRHPYPPPHAHHQPRQPSISITHAPSVPGSAGSLPSASYDTPSPVDLGEALAPPLEPSVDKGRDSPNAHLMPPPPLPPSSMDVDNDVAALNNQQMMDYMGMIDMGLGMNFPPNLIDGFPPQQHQQHQQQQQQQEGHMDDIISGINWSMDDFHRQQQQQQHPQPATPASIMNIGRLHHHPAENQQASLSATPASTAPTTPASAFSSSVSAVPLPLALPAAAVPSSAAVSSPTKTTATRPKRANSTAARAAKDAASTTSTTSKRTSKAATPSMKPILPAGTSPSLTASSSNPNSNSGTSSLPPLTPLPPSATSSTTSPAIQPTLAIRKTSHKAAEQKRRDSLKTTFDDLRKLLPPIALPNSTAEDLAAALSDPNTSASSSTSAFPYFMMAPPHAPLLPGAKPPRGPPKTGAAGDDLGPNKAVSKLQLLICGNEFIRMMKGRVERRDEEIARLRKEVRRLQALVPREGGGEEQEGEGEFEVERDLDACERERFLAEIKDHRPSEEDMDDADDE